MAKKHVTIPIFVPHLGCPNTCAFCNQWQVSGAVSIPDKDFVQKQIDEYLKTISHDIDNLEVAFFGGSFTAIDLNYQRELLEAIKPYWTKLTGIRLSTRPDAISEEILNFLKDYHVTTIELGAQSFDNEILKNAHRGHSAEDIFKASTLIKKDGLNLVIQLMPGLPGDTEETSLESGKKALLCNPDAVRIYPTVVLKNTLLAQLYKNQQYMPLSMDDAVNRSTDLYNLFSQNHVAVIRMGLHPMTPDEQNDIIGGPYHNSFGFLVKSRSKRRNLEKLFDQKKNLIPKFSSPILIIPKTNSEEYIGMKKDNITFLEEKYSLNTLKYEIQDIISPILKF